MLHLRAGSPDLSRGQRQPATPDRGVRSPAPVLGYMPWGLQVVSAIMGAIGRVHRAFVQRLDDAIRELGGRRGVCPVTECDSDRRFLVWWLSH
jgi:hypothetical protein